MAQAPSRRTMAHNRAVSRSWGGALAAATMVLLLAACGGEDKLTFDELPFLTAPPEVPTPTVDPSAIPSAIATAAPTVSTTPSSTSTGKPGGPIADGRHPAYLAGIDAANGTVTVDVVQFFTGTAATQAATEDRAAEVPNDYWVRNRDSLLRTLSVGADARITVNTLAAEETGNSRKNVAVPLTKLVGYPSLAGRLFWVTVSGGTVTVLAEQYLP